MIMAATDPLTGAARDAVYIDSHDAGALGVADGDPLTLVSEAGSFAGRAKLVRLPSRTLQVHWPEGNVLLAAGPTHREPGSRIPDYNAVVTMRLDAGTGVHEAAAGRRRRRRRGRAAVRRRSGAARTTRVAGVGALVDVAAPFLIGLAVGWLLSPAVPDGAVRGARRRPGVAGDGASSGSSCAGSRGTAARPCRS